MSACSFENLPFTGNRPRNVSSIVIVLRADVHQQNLAACDGTLRFLIVQSCRIWPATNDRRVTPKIRVAFAKDIFDLGLYLVLHLRRRSGEPRTLLCLGGDIDRVLQKLYLVW